MLLHFRTCNRRLLDRRRVRRGRHAQLAAQFSIDLQHQLDFLLCERGGVDLGPRRVEDVAVLRRVAQLLPQRVRDVRHDGIQHAQQQREPFTRELDTGRCGVRGHALECIEHFHSGRDDGVVLDATVIVVGLLQMDMHLAPDRAQRWRGVHPVHRDRGARERFGAILRVRPEPLQESVRALDGVIRPQRRILRRAGKHDKQTRRVGTVFRD